MEKKLTPESEPKTRVNDLGNTVKTWDCCEARALCGDERYYWDMGPCGADEGWVQYDTSQDAWYFGVWVNPEKRLTLTYAEGDLSVVECPTDESFTAELASMAKCYGSPPPSFVTIDNDGTVTKHYEERVS